MFFAVPVVELMLVALLIEVTLVAVLVEVRPCNITAGDVLKLVTAGVDDEVLPALIEFDKSRISTGLCAENHPEKTELLQSKTE